MLLTLALACLPLFPPPLPPPVPPDITPPPAVATSPSSSAAPLRHEPARWPVSSHLVVRRASLPLHPWDSGHRGIDIAASPGEEVVAVAAGRVHFAGEIAGQGSVSIDHGGLRTTYTPVAPLVAQGEWVDRGEVIGTVVEEHCPGGCLHLGLRDGERYYDPFTLFETPRMRLWPSGPGVGLAEGPAQPLG